MSSRKPPAEAHTDTRARARTHAHKYTRPTEEAAHGSGAELTLQALPRAGIATRLALVDLSADAAARKIL